MYVRWKSDCLWMLNPPKPPTPPAPAPAISHKYTYSSSPTDCYFTTNYATQFEFNYIHSLKSRSMRDISTVSYFQAYYYGVCVCVGEGRNGVEWFSIAFVCAISEEKKKIIIRKREHTQNNPTPPEIILFAMFIPAGRYTRARGESLYLIVQLNVSVCCTYFLCCCWLLLLWWCWGGCLNQPRV